MNPRAAGTEPSKEGNLKGEPFAGLVQVPLISLIRSRKTRLYLHLFAFFIIEIGFIILGAVCLHKPIPLPIKLNIKHFHLTDVSIKGGFATIFVVWHSIAVFMGAYMTNDAFSREWSAQLGPLAPMENDEPLAKTVDRVSTVTSGHLGRSLHLLKGKPTGTFKIAFLVSLSFLVIRPLGSGAINATTAHIQNKTTIQIGQLLSHPFQNFTETLTTQDRANAIVRLENFENTTFGLTLPKNMFAPVPKVDLKSFNGSIEYHSDVIEFHHDCQWEAPKFKFSNVSGSVVTSAAGQLWNGATVRDKTNPSRNGSSIGSLYNVSGVMPVEQFEKSAFIFFGGDSSLLNEAPYAVDLMSLPTTNTGTYGAGVDYGSNSLYAPLSSVLVCDPQLQITSGRVRVTSKGTQSIQVVSGKKPINNIQRSAAINIFTQALVEAVIDPESDATTFVNLPASKLFMNSSSTVEWNSAQWIRPFHLSVINQNMDKFILSAAKAYIDGYTRNETSSFVRFATQDVSATFDREIFALTTSMWQFIATTVLVTITTVLLCILCGFSLAYERDPFDLPHVYAAFSAGRGRGAELVRGGGV